jgi:uncharacterized protein YkwD
LLLFALGTAAFLFPKSSGDGQRRTAAEATPGGTRAVGVARIGSSPGISSAPAGTASPSTSRPRSTPAGPRSATPARSSTAGRRAGTAPSPTASDARTAQEDEVTALVNRERAAAGCGPLRTDERLRSAARAHSQDMAANDYFSHTGRNGSSFVDRIAAAGYPRNEAGGENIALGYRTPEDVMDGWMNSAGHRANILNCDFKAIGVGLAQDSSGTPYWTQDFGRA